MLISYVIASSNHPELVNIRLVSGEERQINTFEVKLESTVLLDTVAFLNKLTKILCSMLTMTMTWHKVNWLKALFRLTSTLSKSSRSRFSYLIATENENNRQKILLAGTKWTWLCPWLGIIIVGRWDSIFVNSNSKVPNWHLPNSANPLLYL